MVEDYKMDAQGFLDYIRRSKAKTTGKSYRNGISHFCQWYKGEYSVGKLNEILEERKVAMRDEDPQVKWKFERLVEEWHRHQINNGGSVNSARTRYVAVCQFFKFFDLDLKVSIIPSEVKTTVLSERDYLLTVEDLGKMYKVADLRGRALLLMAKDLGLRLSDFQKIEVNQLPDLKREAPIPFRVKTKKEHITSRGFLSSETVQVLKDYVKILKKRGDTKYLWPSNSGKKPMSQQGIGKWLKTLAEKAGIETGQQQFSFHCFRRLLLRGAIETGLGLTAGKLLVGKAVPQSDETYISKVNLSKSFIKLSKYLNVTGSENEVSSDLKETVIAQQNEIAEVHSSIKEHKNRLDVLSQELKATSHQLETLQNLVCHKYGGPSEVTLELEKYGFVAKFKRVKVHSFNREKQTVQLLDLEDFAMAERGTPKNSFVQEYVYSDKSLETKFLNAKQHDNELELLLHGNLVIALPR